MKDYISLAMRTCAPGDQILHSAIGMVTEAAELDSAPDRKNYLEEMGDIMWYVALGCHYLGISLDEAEEMATNPDDHPVMIAAGFISVLKKQIFYGKQPDRREQTALLGDMITTLRGHATAEGVSLDWVMEQNIAKLQKRYPDKFTEDRAINR